MTERNTVPEVREGKSGKGKTTKRGKSEVPPPQQQTAVANHRSVTTPPESEGSEKGAPNRQANQEPQVIAKIRQHAYRLYEAGGYQHGHDLEHWLEAERQVTGSSERSERSEGSERSS